MKTTSTYSTETKKTNNKIIFFLENNINQNDDINLLLLRCCVLLIFKLFSKLPQFELAATDRQQQQNMN